MILISHRGNLNGPNKERENSPSYIMEAFKSGFNVEIDVWYLDSKFYLGHDKPTYEIEKNFLNNSLFWCHAKNLNALVEMLKYDNIHCFWHQEDDVVLTSKKYIWTYPGKEIALEKAIAVVPERVNYNWDLSNAAGVCSDYITDF